MSVFLPSKHLFHNYSVHSSVWHSHSYQLEAICVYSVPSWHIINIIIVHHVSNTYEIQDWIKLKNQFRCMNQLKLNQKDFSVNWTELRELVSGDGRMEDQSAWYIVWLDKRKSFETWRRPTTSQNDQHQQLQRNINTFGTQLMAKEWEFLSHHST